MKLRTFLIAGVSALFGLCLALVIVRSAPVQPGARGGAVQQPTTVKTQRGGAQVAREPIVGRFKLEMHEGIGPFMYDTTTGDCWKYDGDDWASLGNPKNAAVAQK